MAAGAALRVVAAGPPEALGASFLYRAALMITPGGRELSLLRGRPRPGFAASTLHPQDTLLQRLLEPEGERRAREARHPAPRPACLQRPLEPEGERRAREARHPAPRPACLQARRRRWVRRLRSAGPGTGDFVSAMDTLRYSERADEAQADGLVPPALLGGAGAGLSPTPPPPRLLAQPP
eukprot:tig00020710_g13283.t1